MAKVQTKAQRKEPIQDNGQKVYTPKGAAPIVGLSWRRVRTLCKKGRIPGAYKNQWNRWCIPATVVDNWKARRKAIQEAMSMPLAG